MTSHVFVLIPHGDSGSLSVLSTLMSSAFIFCGTLVTLKASNGFAQHRVSVVNHQSAESKDVTHMFYEADVGRCVETCHASDTITTKALPEMSYGSSSCNPTELTSRSYPLFGDSKYKTAISKCGYQHTSGGCSRQALFKSFFKGTSYSRRHDMGVCLGSCGNNGHSCKAIDSVMIGIKGPNGEGELTVRVIKKCGCVNPICHRVAFREVFKRKTGKAWIQEEKDVGMCVGTGCPRDCIRCFFGNKYCGDHCMVYRERACIATNYTTEYVHTGDHEAKTIHTITECGCR